MEERERRDHDATARSLAVGRVRRRGRGWDGGTRLRVVERRFPRRRRHELPGVHGSGHRRCPESEPRSRQPDRAPDAVGVGRRGDRVRLQRMGDLPLRTRVAIGGRVDGLAGDHAVGDRPVPAADPAAPVVPRRASAFGALAAAPVGWVRCVRPRVHRPRLRRARPRRHGPGRGRPRQSSPRAGPEDAGLARGGPVAPAPGALRPRRRLADHPVPTVAGRRAAAAEVVRVRRRRPGHLLRDQRDPRGARHHLLRRPRRDRVGSRIPRDPRRRRDRDPPVPPLGSRRRGEEGRRGRHARRHGPRRVRGRGGAVGIPDRRPREHGCSLRGRPGARDRVPAGDARRTPIRRPAGVRRRATPYEVLTEFSERVGTSYATEDVLPRMAQVLGGGDGS